MKDKNKHTVGDEKDALSSFLVSSVPCRGGGDISLTGRRDGACAVQPLPSLVHLPAGGMDSGVSVCTLSRFTPPRGCPVRAVSAACDWVGPMD